MLTIDQFEKKTGLKHRTIIKAIKDDRIRHEYSDNRGVLIPDDEIRPLRKAQVQSFLWVLLKFKNNPTCEPDMSSVEKIHQSEIESVFLQLSYRNYLDGITPNMTIDELFASCRITNKGFGLVEGDKLPGNSISNMIQVAELFKLVPILVDLVQRWLGAP